MRDQIQQLKSLGISAECVNSEQTKEENRAILKRAREDLQNNGMGIVILPQGIMTFKSGFKKLYKYIIEGRVLVVSTYPPKAGWSVGFASLKFRSNFLPEVKL